MTWQQQKDEPLFPDLIWSRPENRRSAGKLLIIGGQAGEFMKVSQAYAAAEKAGAGAIRVLMPESLRKITEGMPGIEYAPANSSGSFAKNALGMMNEMSEWADHVLLAGDIGQNSETVTILDGYLLRCTHPVTISGEALDSIALPMEQLVKRKVTILLDERKLQKLSKDLDLPFAITSSMPLQLLAEKLSMISNNRAGLVVLHGNFVLVAHNGRVSSTIVKQVNFTGLSSYVAVWNMWQPKKLFESLTTAIQEYQT